MLVLNKDFSSVLETAEVVYQMHSNLLKYVDGDINRVVKLAVML
jgi:hypothetical protein